MTRKNRFVIFGLILLLLVSVLPLTVSAAMSPEITQLDGSILNDVTKDNLKERGSVVLDKISEMLGEDFALTPYVEKAADFINANSTEGLNLWYLILGLCFLVVCLFGYRLVRALIKLCGFLIGFGCGIFAMNLINARLENPLPLYVILIVAGVCGILVAILYAKLYKLAVFCLGAGGGFLLVSMFSDLFPSSGGYVAAVVIAAVVMGFLALKLERVVLIILTSAVGGFYAGRYFPATFALQNEVVAIVLFAVFALLGLFVQFKDKKKKKK